MKRLVLSLFVLAAALPGQEARVLRAGASASNITPPLGSLIVGGWNPTPATYVHDELYARALVLEDGRTRLAFVVCDNVGIPRVVFDEARRAIHEKTGIPPENLLMSSTHTHSAASARGIRSIDARDPLDDYQKFVASRIADAVRRAIHNLEPARIGWGVGHEPGQVFNRRWRMKPGTPLPNPYGGTDRVVMNPRVGDSNLLEPAGPTDPAIHFLSVQSAAGRPIALLANYSLHYVGGVSGTHISADYFGVFAARMEELLGARGQDPPFIAMMSNGTSGNINNINFRGDPEGRKWKPYEKMRAVANIVSAEVFRQLQTVVYRDWVELKAAVREIPLRVRVPTAAEVERAEAVLRRPKGTQPVHQREEIYAQRTLNMKDWPAEIPLILQTLRVGEVGIAAIPNEVFVEIGLEIREKSPLKPTFTISLANGSYGYLPTVEQHKLGGYETWRGTNWLEIEAAPKIVKTVLELLNGLRP